MAEEVQDGQLGQDDGVGAAAPAPVCAGCGTTAADPALASLTWIRAVENGREVWTCERCSREHLRSIEAKLDSTWW